MILTDDWRMSYWGARVQTKKPFRSCRRSQLRGERSEVLRPWTWVRQVEVASVIFRSYFKDRATNLE
jgi:hypothetical protein